MTHLELQKRYEELLQRNGVIGLEVMQLRAENTRLQGELAKSRQSDAMGVQAIQRLREENTRLREKCGAFESQLQFLASRLENESQKVRDQDRNLPKRSHTEHVLLLAEWELLDRLQAEVLNAIPADDIAASDKPAIRQPEPKP